MELAIVALCAALLSWVFWTAVTTDRQVTAELERLRHEAAVRWTALVETGVPAERATTQGGRPAVRAARATRAQQVLAGGIGVTMLLLGGVARRVRSRRRAGLSPT
jgi:hypothetical protein